LFALSGVGGKNDVQRVKRGRWNKKVWETLVYTKIHKVKCLIFNIIIPMDQMMQWRKMQLETHTQKKLKKWNIIQNCESHSTRPLLVTNHTPQCKSEPPDNITSSLTKAFNNFEFLQH